MGLRCLPLVALALLAPAAQAAPPASPTPAQVAALGELQKEADAFETAARDYRGVLARIVQHHYEDRRRRVLAALDAELAIEKRGLADARQEAIRRLEIFLASNSGASAHPEKTPDAMFRLAALYEERARATTDSSDDGAAGLGPAIALYERILREFPKYREIAATTYYLGHAYGDAGRASDAQRAFRSLVCHNRYPWPTASTELPQDHDRAWWQAWEARRRGPAERRGAQKKGEEAAFENPYPEDCQSLPQTVKAGQEPRYLAEVWWLIGDYHFNEVDPAGGPYNLNRADAAYRQSLKWKKPPVHGVAMYKLAWTHFKQQRYEAATRGFVALLGYADEQQKATGDPGADFRSEAHAYIAGALTYLDFAGPAPEEPHAARADVLDGTNDPRAAEAKMRVATRRIQDPKLIPQDKKWTPDLYKALAAEYRELGQLHNMIEVDELFLRKWPLHRDAPVVQNDVAEAWERLAALSREGTSERAEATAHALDARTKLASYTGATPWFDANKDDPEAIHAADRLSQSGLRRAAADHTNAGNALWEKALATSDKASRQKALEAALAEYRLAARAWGGFPKESDADGSYERRFWLADANHKIVAIQVARGESPSAAEIDAARKSAIAVRDSNEDDKYRQPAAHMVVDIAQQVLQGRYAAFERTGGREGIERRDRVKTTGSGAGERVVSEPLPREIKDAIAAREEYASRVPAERDPARNAALHAYQIADYHFLYGQFDEAKKRFVAVNAEECKRSPHGFAAWRRLLTMAALSHDADEVRALAQRALDNKTSCALNDADRVLEQKLSREALGAASYDDAKTAFETAQKLPDGPQRTEAWKRAAALYAATLEKAPDGAAAPEAAINGAHAYKQVGDYEQAIRLYERFIKSYGNEATMAKLEKGDPSVSPPKLPDPAAYNERVGFLRRAHGALASAYVALLDVRRAADAFDAIAQNTRFPAPARRDAARNAAVLHASAGDKEPMAASRASFLALDPPAEQKAEIDWLVAEADLKAWDERAPDENGNRAARQKAIATMDAYLAAKKSDPAAAVYTVRAAYHAARLRRAGRDPRAAERCRDTVAAFDRLRAGAPVVEGKNTALDTPEADMAAECAYLAIEQRIASDFEAGSQPRYTGTVDKVVAAYRADLKKAEVFHKELAEIVDRYASPTWAIAARAKQGALYDACRTRLYFTRAPGLELFSAREERLLAQLVTVDPDRADAYRQKRVEDWRAARERELAAADAVMVKRYAEAVLFARALKLRSPPVDAAISRLAGFTALLGDAKLRDYSQGIIDPATKQPFAYEDGFFLRTRPGMALSPSALALPAPRPVSP